MGAMCAFLEVDVLQQLRCITRQITLQSAMGARCAVLEVDVLQQLRCVIRQITRQFNRILCCSLPFFAYASLWVVFASYLYLCQMWNRFEVCSKPCIIVFSDRKSVV